MSVKTKALVCSVSIKDLVIQPFKGSGPGGQKRNKCETAIRLIHPPSGARAESQVHKSQTQNKKAAFRKLAEHPDFLSWARMEAARACGLEAEIEKRVDQAMQPRNLKVESRQPDGTWSE